MATQPATSASVSTGVEAIAYSHVSRQGVSQNSVRILLRTRKMIRWKTAPSAAYQYSANDVHSPGEENKKRSHDINHARALLPKSGKMQPEFPGSADNGLVQANHL